MNELMRWFNVGLGIFFIGAGACFGAIAFLLINTWKPLAKYSLVRRILGYDDGLGFVITFCVLTNVGGILAALLVREFFASLSPDLFRVCVGLTFLVLDAVVLVLLKVMFLWHYAILELLFAVVVGGTALYRLHRPATALDALSLVTSLYLLVRGFDNLNKALDPQLDKWREGRGTMTTRPKTRAPGA
jgi:hypothetical protein